MRPLCRHRLAAPTALSALPALLTLLTLAPVAIAAQSPATATQIHSAAADRRRRLHTLRTPRPRLGEVPHHLRGLRHHAGRHALLQPDPHREHRDRRVGDRPRLGEAARRSRRWAPRWRAPAAIRVADSTQRYIRVTLPRPVPGDGGESRILILKTYEDAASYFTRGDTLVFTRPLGIKRNAVVLPAGYELVASSYPAQVLQEPDGRIGISFWNATPAEAPVTMRAVPRRRCSEPPRRRPRRACRRAWHRARAPGPRDRLLPAAAARRTPSTSTTTTPSRARVRAPTSTSCAQGAPSPTRVRGTSTPGARSTSEVLKGDAITRAGLDVPNVTPTHRGGGLPVPAVAAGRPRVRLRMFETYTDTVRYRLVGRRTRRGIAPSAVPRTPWCCPRGGCSPTAAIPAVVSTRADGRVQLDFINPRPDEIAVLITARRR